MPKQKKRKNSKLKKQKRKLNKKRVLLFFIIAFLLFLIVYMIINTKITNIYISGNTYLTDQEIIDLSGIKNYPGSINNPSCLIKKKVKNDIFILDANVRKNLLLNKVYIDIKENYPLFYSIPQSSTVLYSGEKIEDSCSCATLINVIPDTIYDEFIEKMQLVDKDILSRISEIEYKPNEVDDERFFLLMNDGNYVYITLYKFLSINKYIDIVKSFNNQNGILYLDSGEYFSLFDE